MYVTTLERLQDLERFHGRRGTINWSRPPILQRPVSGSLHLSAPEVLISPPQRASEAAITYLEATAWYPARNTVEDTPRTMKNPVHNRRWKID